MKYLARFIMWLAGWKYKGELPAEKKSGDYICSSYFELGFLLGRTGFFESGYSGFYFDEEGILLFPLGMILRALNVIPVDRGNKDSQLVEQMITEFKQRDSMYLCITPEGSRKKRKKWKKGFLVIAKAAGVPVYLGRIDYKGKYCEVGPLFYPTEDVDADLAYIMSTYHDANPKYPENFSNGN